MQISDEIWPPGIEEKVYVQVSFDMGSNWFTSHSWWLREGAERYARSLQANFPMVMIGYSVRQRPTGRPPEEGA